MHHNVISAILGTLLLAWLASFVMPVVVGLSWLVSLIFIGA